MAPLPIDSFLDQLSQDETLQDKARTATTAQDIATIAQAAGFVITAGDVIAFFASQLLNGDAAVVEKRFDSLGWDIGELLWALKTWR
ncbi:Nif11-like leader peptide family natural product precursor [Synechococcus sp. CS-1324]|uniref:Nif11-like leader peptide family natural product precursor n=1 Tax=unclassified Synechococcus TaxID=2626047 RepID=UPI000DB4C25A|nr:MULTISPECIES: Nif11-like leader peptide family natural product precursor [unclassified Synechococcus]MCT0230042.1 Nif11-like leader peptide family natural product precursor [Synechococcus sp. CS-1324]PZV03779.1 MAG: hypothetical protein DCF23_08275 [Cyanobium sp.]